MRRSLLAVIVAGAVISAAEAHFIWIAPNSADGTKVQAVFSENLLPDDNVDIKKIQQTKFYVREANGKVSATTAQLAEHAYHIALPSQGASVVAGVCDYGVLQRGDSKPFLLTYFAKLVLTPADAAKSLDALTMDIIATGVTGNRFVVLYRGKPVPEAEVAILAPNSDKAETTKTDARGEFAVTDVKPGLYGLRARHIATVSGERDGKKYDEERSYATLVMNLSKATSAAPSPAKEDPAATKLLADARAARAEWVHFPGFSADVAVNLNGQLYHGRVAVDATGKAAFVDLDPTAEKWAKPILASLVSHRLAASTEGDPTPCAFVSEDANHPLGREVHVLNDEMHSSYRIKDRQIMVVNRAMKESRFSITMQENNKNAEGKYLPANYVVHYWGPGGDLQRTEAHTQTWARTGSYDLPVLARIITAERELTVRCLTLSNHKLQTATSAR